MNLLERLLEQCLDVDVTETSWWTDGVFRALEQDPAQLADAGDGAAAAELPTAMT
jgi:hypothetical protein